MSKSTVITSIKDEWTQFLAIVEGVPQEKQELPDAMQAAGLTQIKLSTGENITISEFYNAHISKANQETAYRWL